ncbi:hypothetical protein AC56_4530 [Escherichia coli 1-182-04_S3_C3]|nr:hypothetical protein AC56_4530 [Escherichia coli 1-182-04_S3_C3]
MFFALLFACSDLFPLDTSFFSSFVYVFRKILNIDATFCFL